MGSRNAPSSASLKLAAALLAAALSGSPAAAAPNPRIMALADEVQAQNYTPALDCVGDYLLALPTIQGDQRGYDQNGQPLPDLLAARALIFQALSASLGAANVYYQYFTAWDYPGANVIGVLPGEGRRYARQFVIAAHYDSAENAGADDNASGAAGLIEAARVLSRYRFGATIIFAAFDQEEERDNGWGQGSRFFAGQAKSGGAKIKGALVLDMVGFNAYGDDWVMVGRSDYENGSKSALMLKKVARAFRRYTQLTTESYTEENATDAYRLYQAGFPAITLIDEFDNSGWPVNPFYHTAADYYLSAEGAPQQYQGADYIDPEYLKQNVRGAVAWAAGQAKLLGPR